jgi:hypothetical protein
LGDTYADSIHQSGMCVRRKDELSVKRKQHSQWSLLPALHCPLESVALPLLSNPTGFSDPIWRQASACLVLVRVL